jgi:hypothetical protein
MTHKGQEILIKVSDFSLPHFNADKSFDSHLDCLNTAYVAAALLEMKKATPTQNPAPFSYNAVRRGIMFDDAATLSWNFDTRMLST